MDYTFEQIANIVDGIVIHPSKESINHIITDSRRAYKSSGCLFIALKGPSHDGHHYIPELQKKGIICFLIDKSYLPSKNDVSSGFIQVENTTEAFQKIAAYHRGSFTGKVIAITGSNGKTVVKEWTAQLLSKLFSVSKNPKSYNSQIGVPVSVLMMDAGPDYHLLEAGISKPGEMEKLEAILRPDIGILTNIGDAHQENFRSYNAKLEEKLILFKHAKLIIYNKDNINIIEGIEKLRRENKNDFVSCSFSGDADLKVEIQSSKGSNTILAGLYKSEKHFVEIPFSDSASIENIAHIWLFWLYNNFPVDVFQRGVKSLEPIAMRLEQKEGQRGCTLINDFYNADLHSLAIAIDLLINQLPQKRKTIILSDLLQTGLDDLELVNRINLLLENKKFFRIIGIGALFIKYHSRFNFNLDFYPDTESFLNNFPLSSLKDEAILLKGARAFRFERISKRIEKRIHNTIVEVNMNNLLGNLNYFRSMLSQKTKIMAMVKAASYGSGTYEVAKFLAHQRVDYLGVAFVDEGIQLREARIETPIMVMNPGQDGFEAMIEYHLEPEIFSFQILQEFYKAASLLGIKSYPVHIKIDTGMHRLGFQTSELESLISFVENQDIIKIDSVFSHLAVAEDQNKDEFSHKQAREFEDAVQKIRARIDEPFLAHLVNTAAILRFPEYHFDMVRLGIGLYGIDPSGESSLDPVISLKSTITQIHSLEQGDVIGYGNSGIMNADGRIAVIPIGYADGLDRRLGNRIGRVFCNSSYAPIVGNICMDMCMIDITDIEASEGDEVTIIGGDITLEEMAGNIDTIPYEILTRIPQRVKRVFLFE